MGPANPFRQFVLKVHSRCDLACDHCYIYEHADQSWRSRSAEMTVATTAKAAERIAEHARAHELDEVCLILHGGEPLLAGVEQLDRIITVVRETLSGVCDLELCLHTNGVLLNREFCELFGKHGVRVGVSLDGDRAANDRHRLYRNGRSSYDKAIKAIELLRTEYPALYSGLLCTIDIANDPLTVYDALVELDPPAIDFLWPHHTWENPPPRTSETAFADWLIPIMDRWLAQGRPVPVRMFDSIISAGTGGASFSESLGLEPTDLLVIETDGTYEQADSLKTAFQGAAGTGHDVFHHAIDEVATHPGIAARQGGLSALCDTCRACPVVAICGGGLYAHRYRPGGSSFDNPSVYCQDLLPVIEHLQVRTSDLPLDVLRSLATGYGDSPAIDRLRRFQTILSRSQLAVLSVQGPASPAWEVLAESHAIAPDAVDSVLTHPYIRPWVVDQLNDGRADDGLLATAACVAAVRAGLRTRLTVPVRDGGVYLPTLGRYAVSGREQTTVDIAGGELRVVGADRFEATRRLTAGGFSVVLEDLDPVRTCHGPAAARLTDEQVAAWQQSFEEAWFLLEKQYGDYATGIAGALTTIVPLDRPPDGLDASSTARDAFGSVAIALPDTPALLCLLLMHEFQHVKMGAILDFVGLFKPDDQRLYTVPWRPDPRPFEAVLQGAYAHMAVADFWGRRALAPQREIAVEAERQYNYWYSGTLDVVDRMEESGTLTGLGQQFVAGMRTTLESWRTAS